MNVKKYQKMCFKNHFVSEVRKSNIQKKGEKKRKKEGKKGIFVFARSEVGYF